MYGGNGSSGEAGRSGRGWGWGGWAWQPQTRKGCTSALGHPEPTGHSTRHLLASAYYAACQMTERPQTPPNHREDQVSFGKTDIKKNKYIQAIFSF